MKKMMTGLLVMAGAGVYAQDSTGSLTISGYTELYYQYDFNKPADNNRPGFVYSHNRHNEFNLNLGFVKAGYSADRVRANLAIGAGTYMNANYAAEPGVLKNVYEANAGIKLGKKNLWLDAGIFPSHIGFESAIGKDCRTLTRSMAADNTPYYEAGTKLSYGTEDGKWSLTALALNGWQRIKRVDGNSRMNWGTQIQYKPTSSVLLNYSTFLGTDKPDSARLNRIFHNLYGIFTLDDKWELILGFDIGTEDKTVNGSGQNTWYSPACILRFQLADKWSMAARGEYYSDKNGVIIATNTPNGFQTLGLSINMDYTPVKNAILRFALCRLDSKDKIFVKSQGMSGNNVLLSSSLAVSF